METVRALWRSTVGKKAVAALTGTLMFLWLVAHLVGNLLLFAGPAAMNGYAEALHSRPWLLWPARVGLFICAVLHVTAVVQLTLRARRARPQRYLVQTPIAATISGRTMRWGGPILFAFLAFHIVHLKSPLFHPDYVAGSTYHNVVTGLAVPAVALFYLFGIAALGMHLLHGLFSARRSLGLVGKSPADGTLRKPVAKVVAIVLWLGFALIPLAIGSGLLR